MTSPSLSVLVVSGDALVTGSLEHMLSQARGTRVQRATTIASACAKLSEQWIDAVVVDLAMIDGTELTELTRVGQPEPVTVLGVLRQDCALRTTEALRAGAQECLLFQDLTTDRLMRSLRQGIERQRVQQRLADLALRDELTGLYNRRGFFAIGEHLRRECLRNARDLALVQVDVDGLKAINDSFGHASGDQAIAATAAILRCTFRESDVVARLGSDEFVAVALDADRSAAAARWRASTTRSRSTTSGRGHPTALVQRGIIRADAARASDAQRPPRQRGPRAVCRQAPHPQARRGSRRSPPLRNCADRRRESQRCRPDASLRPAVRGERRSGIRARHRWTAPPRVLPSRTSESGGIGRRAGLQDPVAKRPWGSTLPFRTCRLGA